MILVRVCGDLSEIQVIKKGLKTRSQNDNSN
jgi:hypothetical protein